MRKYILTAAVLGALSAAAPALAQTSESEQRLLESQRQLEQFQVQQRIDTLNNQLFQLEQDRRTAENLRRIEEQSARQPVIANAPPPAPLPINSVTQQQLLDAQKRKLDEAAEAARALQPLPPSQVPVSR